MDRPVPNDTSDKLVTCRPIEDFVPVFQPQWHTFEEISYIVLTSHRGVVLLRESQWTHGGKNSAINDAICHSRQYHIDQGPTELIVWAITRTRLYDRKYVGEGPNPRYYSGSSQPKMCALYTGHAINFRTTHLEVVWSSAPHAERDRLFLEIQASHFLQGD